jgi:hypothetical protein
MSSGKMPVESPQSMWTMSADRWTLRMEIPPLPIAGLPQPVRVQLDFDAETIDALLHRLTLLRALMLPAPQRN